jgi:hypothetical protein
MLMIRKFLFLIGATLLLSFAWHKYYVTITNVEMNNETQTFEASIKFIGHDLELVLESAGVPALYLGTAKENTNADEYLMKYISKHFEIKVDDKVVPFHFIGKEINNDDFIYCYLESEKVNSPNKITFTNSLLTEKFEKQANILYLKVDGKKVNYTFTKEKRRTYYNIK